MINENVSFESQFRFRGVSENDIQLEVLTLNPKTPVTSVKTHTKILKRSSVCKCNNWEVKNSEVLGKQYLLIF